MPKNVVKGKLFHVYNGSTDYFIRFATLSALYSNQFKNHQ